MLTCPDCSAAVEAHGGQCPSCGRKLSDDPVWKIVFRSPETLRKHYDSAMIHNRLMVPRRVAVEPETTVRLRIVLPEERGEVWIAAKVVGSLEHPGRSKAPFDVQLELLDLDREKKERLRTVTRSVTVEQPSPLLEENRPGDGDTIGVLEIRPAAPPPAAPGDSDDMDDLIKVLLERRANPLPAEPEPVEDAPAVQAVVVKERLPEEVAQELTDFTVQFVRAVTKSSYYSADHQAAGKAKAGIYAAFHKLVGDHPEVTFFSRKTGERFSVLVYGIFDEPADLSRAMLPGTAEIYIPKLSHYFEANGIVSVSFKPALSEEAFHEFVDMLASPGGGSADGVHGIIERLAGKGIHDISVVVARDCIGAGGLSWRVEMTLARLKKDLSVIPLYEHLSEEELKQVRLQVFRDVLRPLRQVNLIRELLENCDRIVEVVEEFDEAQLGDIESQVLASVPDESLPPLLEGLVEDIAAAKQAGEKQLDRLLRLSRRVIERLTPDQARSLEDAFRVLLAERILDLEELPISLQRKFTLERDANRFLARKKQILARLDVEPDDKIYQVLLDFLLAIFPEFLSRADPSGCLSIIDHIGNHRVADPPFPERPQLAHTWLEQIVYDSLAEHLVPELTLADKRKREILLELCRRLGDETVPLLFEALSECENASTRNAIREIVVDLKLASRAVLRGELARDDLAPHHLIELLRILGRIGATDPSKLLEGVAGHADPHVRLEVLDAACRTAPEYAQARALTALSDRDAKLRETALKILFDSGCDNPEFFAFCRRALNDSEAPDENLARRICAGLAAYEQGEARERSLTVLRGVLGETSEERKSLWASVKRSVHKDPENLPVLVAVCQALGRMAASEAHAELAQLAKHPNAVLQRAAQQALKRIPA